MLASAAIMVGGKMAQSYFEKIVNSESIDIKSILAEYSENPRGLVKPPYHESLFGIAHARAQSAIEELSKVQDQSDLLPRILKSLSVLFQIVNFSGVSNSIIAEYIDVERSSACKLLNSLIKTLEVKDNEYTITFNDCDWFEGRIDTDSTGDSVSIKFNILVSKYSIEKSIIDEQDNSDVSDDENSLNFLEVYCEDDDVPERTDSCSSPETSDNQLDDETTILVHKASSLPSYTRSKPMQISFAKTTGQIPSHAQTFKDELILGSSPTKSGVQSSSGSARNTSKVSFTPGSAKEFILADGKVEEVSEGKQEEEPNPVDDPVVQRSKETKAKEAACSSKDFGVGEDHPVSQAAVQAAGEFELSFEDLFEF